MLFSLNLFILSSDITKHSRGSGRSDMQLVKSDETNNCRCYTEADIIEHKNRELAGTTIAIRHVFRCPQPYLAKNGGLFS